MGRPLDTSARNTTCQFLKSSLAIAAIAMGFPQTVNAGSLFGNVTADLFAPAETLTSVVVDDVDIDDSEKPSGPTGLEAEDGPEAMTRAAQESQFLNPTPSRFQPGPAQTSPQPQTTTRIDLSDLRGRAPGRPAMLLPLYITFATLQMLDAHSTSTALQNGAIEVNPLMATIAGNTGALYATKIATAAATVFIGEQLWRKNRLAAIVTMLAVNSAYAMVVHHNYGVANR